jgi:hypothetical protein
MKRFLLVLALGAGFALAQAQEQKPAPPADRPQATGAKPQAVSEAKPEAKPRPLIKSRRHEDARHCLERPNNTEIIKCAEAYL